MSIFATNYIVDENTGEAKLVKHLNKLRIDRGTWNKAPGGWGKSGKKRATKLFNKFIKAQRRADKTEANKLGEE